jgi:GntR family transcriptional regulator
MFVRLDPGSGVPLFLQIAEAIRDAILAGRLARDQRLPTVRDLAARLRVNPATVAAAYDRLADEKLVEARVGAGTFVAFDELRARALRRRARGRVDELIATVAAAADGAGIMEEDVIARLRQAMRRRLARDKKGVPA